MQQNDIPLADPVWQCGDESDWKPCSNDECRDGIVPKLRVDYHWWAGARWHGPYYEATECPDCHGTGRRRYWGRDDQRA